MERKQRDAMQAHTEAMENSTTLATFLLQTRPAVRSVELLGSWDNFTRRYPMEKDVRRGRGTWRGCHSFEEIFYEGRHRSMEQKRAGGLRMGGTYWYFYVLDGDMDFHNPAEPSTTRCPLLPGQLVNIFDVPIELGPEQARQRSQSDTDVPSVNPVKRTMNPADKFVNPRAPPRPCRLRLASAPASLLRLFGRSTRAVSFSSSVPAAEPRRGSAPSATAALSRLLNSPRQAPAPVDAQSFSDSAVDIWESGISQVDAPAGSPSQREVAPTSVQSRRKAASPAKPFSLPSDIRIRTQHDGSPVGAPHDISTGDEGSGQRPKDLIRIDTEMPNDQTPELRLQLPSPAIPIPPSPHLFTERVMSSYVGCDSDPAPGLATDVMGGSYQSGLGVDEAVQSHFSLYSTPSAHSVSSRDYFDVEPISPGLTSSELQYSDTAPSAAVSPCSTDAFHDSLRDVVSAGDDTGDGWARPGFQGYCLPEDQHTSEATIRKLTSSGVVHSVSDVSIAVKHSHDDVLSDWEGRPSDHAGLLEDLVDELAYLGNAISRH